MDWIEPFYTKRSEWMGPTGIFASQADVQPDPSVKAPSAGMTRL